METGETEKSIHRTYLADKDMISANEIPWEERALWWFKINGITDCYEKWIVVHIVVFFGRF